MNNNKISNPKTETSKGIELNDKDHITCLLSTLKEMTKNYATAMTEDSNESLYKSYHSTFKELSNLQRETYELMFQKGWYSLEKEETTKINQKYQMLVQEYTDLGV